MNPTLESEFVFTKHSQEHSLSFPPQDFVVCLLFSKRQNRDWLKLKAFADEMFSESVENVAGKGELAC